MDLIDFERRNTTSELIAFVASRNNTFYCIAGVEYWIGEWWNGYVDISNSSFEIEYFNFLRQFEVSYEVLVKSYEKIIHKGNQFQLEGNKPQIFIDFDRKYFKSFFHDQSLEKRLPVNWTGEYGDVTKLIPTAKQYWIFD